MRDSSGFSVRPTTSESILNPRAENSPATDASTPGSFITNAEITCRIDNTPRSAIFDYNAIANTTGGPMALKITKVDVWAGNLRDIPGGLAEKLEALSAAGSSLQFLIARRDDKQTGMGKVFVTPVTARQAKDAAGRAGLQHATNIGTLRVEGAD